MLFCGGRQLRIRLKSSPPAEVHNMHRLVITSSMFIQALKRPSYYNDHTLMMFQPSFGISHEEVLHPLRGRHHKGRELGKMARAVVHGDASGLLS